MHSVQTPNHVTIHNERIQLEASVVAGALHLRISAWQAGHGFVSILERSGTNATNPANAALRAEHPDMPCLELETGLAGAAQLTIRGSAGPTTFALTLRLDDDSSWIRVSEVLAADRTRPDTTVDWFEAAWRFVGRHVSGAPDEASPPDEVFSPVLTPEPHDVIGRHVLRSPALTAQSGDRAAALIYDTGTLGKLQSLPGCMALLRDDGVPTFRVGLRAHHVRGHVYYAAHPAPDGPDLPGELPPTRPLHFTYHLFAAADAPPGASLDAANRKLWTDAGKRSAAAAHPMPATFPELARQIYPRALDQLWDETTLDGRRVGALRIHRAYRNDVWFCTWFNQLRSAYGLYVWGKETGTSDWVDRARATRDLVLAAPQERGLFPTVFVFGDVSTPHRWVHSHPQGGGLGIYHLFDMSWTAYHLLRWQRDLEPDARSLDFARTYAQGLLSLQDEKGSFPAYVDAHTFAPVTHVDHAAQLADIEAHDPGDRYIAHGLLRLWPEERFVNSAEDATSLLFLAELARALPPDDPDRERFLSAAVRSVAWLESWAIAQARWIDFELYYSCSPKPLDAYDHRSGQWPQNTLCMHTAAAGLLALHEVTGDPRHLTLSRRVMDRLTLYQQVWDPPFLNFAAFGGYGVMNTDGEWSDARQAQFADTHLDLYNLLGDVEHLERAQAALYAAFTTTYLPVLSTLYPTGWHRALQGLAAENHAHGGHDGLCGVSGFDWGTGSALATAAYFLRSGGASQHMSPRLPTKEA